MTRFIFTDVDRLILKELKLKNKITIHDAYMVSHSGFDTIVKRFKLLESKGIIKKRKRDNRSNFFIYCYKKISIKDFVKLLELA